MKFSVLLGVCALWLWQGALPAQAQTREQVPLGVFGVELLAGSLAAAGGMTLAKAIPFGPAQMLGGVVGASLSVGLVGLLFGANGNWLLAPVMALGSWFLSDFFGSGFFGQGNYTLDFFGAVRLNPRDLLFVTTAVGTAFGATVGFNLYR